MATLNPLEQKARSSFIKGFVIALFIGLLIAAGIGYLYYQAKVEEQERISRQKSVLVLTADLKSGEILTRDKVKVVNADGDTVPVNGAATSYDQLLGYFVNSKEGEESEDPAATSKKNALITKTDLYKNTIIAKDMLALQTEQPSSDQRQEEYNMIVLPTNLESGDTVDIRLRLPSGQDYIVLAKKKVTVPTIADVPSSSTIQMKVTEDEILTMSAAIVDAYKIAGCKLYAIRYAEPGLQDKATATYIPAADTLRLIYEDPNIVEQAKATLINFYNQNNEKYRTGVANALSTVDAETQKSSLESGTASEASAQKSDREKYLQALE
ncbi:MAG: SAF domain-containing protein [Clostridia bacterium]|nr:SAF domain-containing protein [Clostridia bacterium]